MTVWKHGFWARCSKIKSATGRCTPRNDKQVLRTFRAETVVSSVVFSLFSATAVAMSVTLFADKHLWQAYTCIALVALHVVITQTYLHTHWGKGALFPQDLQHSKNRKNSLKPSKSSCLKWTFIAISLLTAAVTVAIFSQLFRGMNKKYYNQFSFQK